MPGKPWHQNGRNPEFSGDFDGMQRAGATEGEQREIARVVPLLDRHQADGMCQLIGGDGQGGRRSRGPVQTQRYADLFLDRGCDPLHRRSIGDAGQTIRVEPPEQKIGVSDGNVCAASAIRDRPRPGPGAFGPDL